MDRQLDRSRDQGSGKTAGLRQVKYFMPGQLILHVEHPADTPAEVLLQATRAFLSDDNVDQEWKRKIEPPKPDSILIFPKREDKEFAFSLIVSKLPQVKEKDDELVQVNNQLNSRLQEGSLVLGDQIRLRASSLDWLVGGAHGQSGTGGPGSWPVEAESPHEDTWKFQFQDENHFWSPLSSTDQKGAEVHVAILDTAPTQHARDRAYVEWRWEHPLVESLLGPESPLTVYPASNADLYQTQHHDVLGHHYLMRDHGLFIAGIIHSIAPKAQLHLYEVLNPYGIGSLGTIARALVRILQNPKINGHPLIINCSFMLGIPVKSEGVYDWNFDRFFPIELQDPATLQKTRFSTEEIFDLLAKRKNTVVVAAAGNDAHYDSNRKKFVRPDARYPAAFNAVVGVGALPKSLTQVNGQYVAASYSNLSDAPPKGSYITLGGEAGLENGVLGLYIGDFPDYEEPQGCLAWLLQALNIGPKQQSGALPRDRYSVQPNQIKYKRNATGWAWWAGTSFAAPIVSGILAANQGQQSNLGTQFDTARAETILGDLLDRTDPGTDQAEKVIVIRQQ